MTLTVHQTNSHDEEVPPPPPLMSLEQEAALATPPLESVENDEEITDDLTGFTMILQGAGPAAAATRRMQPTATQEMFIAATRKAIMSQDEGDAFMTHRITPVVLRNDFIVKAINFMEMCQGRAQENGRGHKIKIDQAFRKNGAYIEGWIFVRWMSVSWSAAGFKAHRPGSLPLCMFPRKETNVAALQATLDKIMQEVFPVLMECFPECDIVPVETSQELWKPVSTSRAGSELKDALQRAAGVSSSSVTSRDDSSTVDGMTHTLNTSTPPSLPTPTPDEDVEAASDCVGVGLSVEDGANRTPRDCWSNCVTRLTFFQVFAILSSMLMGGIIFLIIAILYVFT